MTAHGFPGSLIPHDTDRRIAEQYVPFDIDH